MIAAGAVIVAAVGYVGWSLLAPDPYARSERGVRDSRREIAAAVRSFEREVETIAHKAKPGRSSVEAEIDARAAAATRAIDAIVDRAEDHLDSLDIDVRTQHNRIDRIERSAKEGKALIGQLAEEAKQKQKGKGG